MLKVAGPSASALNAVLDNIDKTVKRLNPEKKQLLIGVPADAGEEDNGLPIATNAAMHEFGIGVPERSFIRAPLAANVDKYKKAMEWFAGRVGGGKLTNDQALAQLGHMAVGDIQTAIERGISPANAISTIKKKGSSTPLIDTGRLRQSITFRIVNEGETF